MPEKTFVSQTGHRGRAIVTGRYRYALWRQLDAAAEANEDSTVLFVMLNPSTADAHIDDPTLRRCIGFARSWGYGRLAVGNLYAWRSPKPADLATAPDPVGPDNDDWLADLVSDALLVVVAWGASDWMNPDRALAVCERLSDRAPGAGFFCLGTTADGHPAHPLYLPNDTELERFDHWRELYG